MPVHARTLLAWIAVGLVGLALAAGVTYAATQLSSQRIGLSAEPPSAGEELAPGTTSTVGPGNSTSRQQTGARRGNHPGPHGAGRGHNPDD
jgi:hypothetical protein